MRDRTIRRTLYGNDGSSGPGPAHLDPLRRLTTAADGHHFDPSNGAPRCSVIRARDKSGLVLLAPRLLAATSPQRRRPANAERRRTRWRAFSPRGRGATSRSAACDGRPSATWVNNDFGFLRVLYQAFVRHDSSSGDAQRPGTPAIFRRVSRRPGGGRCPRLGSLDQAGRRRP